MINTVRSIDAVRRATVRICNESGEHFGQGLLLSLEGEGMVILTCHHVVARLNKDNLYVAILQASGQLGPPLRALYDPRRSHPEKDAVVLRVNIDEPSQQPLLHELDPLTYDGTLPDPALGFGHWKTNTFDARVSASTQLDLTVETPGTWPDAPNRYILPFVFRLSNPSDARPGISGSVVLYDKGVLGLAHFSRPAGPDQEREVYLVPLREWAEGWPALSCLIGPLLDKRLQSAAIIKQVPSVNIGKDIVIAGYEPDIYIEPLALRQAQEAIEKQGGVILVGRPRSGKTRLAWTLLQQRPSAFVVIPRDSRPPGTFETSGLLDKEFILFFDDLHRNALSLDPMAWRRALEEASGKQCLVLCTSRDGKDWRQVEESGLSVLLNTLTRKSVVFTSRVGAEGLDLSKNEGLKLAQALHISKQDFEKRFDGTPGSLTLNLEEMAERYKRLRNEQWSGVSMSRFLDAAKLLYEGSQPRLRLDCIRAVAEQIRGEGRMSAETWETLQRRTTEEGLGSVDNDTDDFHTYKPYLENCVAYQPTLPEIENLIPVLIKEKDSEGLGYLGQSLFMRMDSPLAAEKALKAAIELGNDAAKEQLGWLLSSLPDHEVEAEKFFRDQIKAGATLQHHNLGNLLNRLPGREADAEVAYRKAIKEFEGTGGVGIAKWSLANLFKRQNRMQEAETLYREAKKEGIFIAHIDLSEILANKVGHEKEAEQVVAAAIETVNEQREKYEPDNLAGKGRTVSPGDTFQKYIAQLHRHKGNVLQRQSGRELEAEQAFREAIDNGDIEANVGLGMLLANMGRAQEAEKSLRRLIDLKVKGGAVNLGLFLTRQPGREVEAEKYLREGIDEGYYQLYFELGKLLANQEGRTQEAEDNFLAAIEKGDDQPYEWLGYIIEGQPGRESEAEKAYRLAIDSGNKEAYSRLESLLARQAKNAEDMETFYREVIQKGITEAYLPLAGRLLARVADGQIEFAEEAEHAYRKALEMGQVSAQVGLGAILSLQPERSAEGYDILSKAIEAGIAGAEEMFDAFNTKPAIGED